MELSGIVGKWFTGSCLKKNMESGIGDMLFHSLEFFIYFPVVVLVYFFIPKRCKCLWLLAASYYFYMSWNIGHTFLIAFSTFVTWVSGLLLGRCHRTGKRRYRKWIVAASVSLNLGILFYFKYFDFLLANLNMVITRMGFPMLEKPFEIVLPVGISFYTFQALGYTVDVYRGEVEPEKNLFRYALFVSFFPQLVAGPIERSKNLLWQIRRIPTMSFRRLWNYERIASGLILMLWGYFQKLVLADRLCILVDTVYQDWQQYGTAVLVLATAAFSMQIYCDFASYSIIAMGAAKVMGFTLMEKFPRALFFAQYPGILAQMAYFSESVVSGLFVYSAGREPPRCAARAVEPYGSLFGKRPLAWRKMALCSMGRDPWRVSGCRCADGRDTQTASQKGGRGYGDV